MNDDNVRGLANGLTNYGDKDFALYLRRSFARSMGYSNEMLARPTVGIAYTPSGFNNCHRHFPEMLEAVKRGVIAAGGLPLEFPTVSLGEVFLNPTSLRFRNLMAMDTEEMIRAQPMDSVVLMGGCDKTVPAQLMGAVSAGLPAIQLVGGPMMTGRHQGERLGACTDCRRFWGKFRAGQIGQAEIDQVEGRLSTTSGTCAVMGTASTMACIAEALGMMLPGTAAIPAVHADRLRAAEASGIAAVHLIGSGRSPDKIITAKSVENALRVLLAIGGSTNAIIHLTAIAGRAGIAISLDRLNALSDTTPVLVNLKPTGSNYMEDFFAAVVFTSLDDLAARIDDPSLDVKPDDYLVLQNAGPFSASCMPEAGYLPIPKKLAAQGVKDMVRLSDARMSGTAFGTVILHVTPDSASGGPLAFVRNGDRIRLSVKDRRIDLLVDKDEIERRKTSTGRISPPVPARGYGKLYAEQILGADEGCDFRFLKPTA